MAEISQVNYIYCKESVPFIHFKLTAFQFHQLSPDFQEYVQATEQWWKPTFTMSIIIQGVSIKVFFFSLKRIIFMHALLTTQPRSQCCSTVSIFWNLFMYRVFSILCICQYKFSTINVGSFFKRLFQTYTLKIHFSTKQYVLIKEKRKIYY